MKSLFIIPALITLFFLPGLAQEAADSLKQEPCESVNGSVPKEYEEAYNNFINKITRKNEDPSKDPFKMPIPEMTFDLDYAGITTFPVVLSNDTYSSTEALVDRYNTYKSNHGKTVAANDKMYEDRFYQKQEDVRRTYEDLVNRNTSREYLILTGILSTDNGERIIKEKYIILLDPKYNDREWIQWKVDQHMQKRVAMTLTSVDGTAMEFLDSNRDLEPLAERYEDPVIKFILSPVFSNGKSQNLPFFSNN